MTLEELLALNQPLLKMTLPEAVRRLNEMLETERRNKILVRPWGR